MQFDDRVDAGRQLAAELAEVVDDPNVLVIGIPRGGVVTGYEVALKLNAMFDVALSRKLGAPGNEELAIGAIAENGTRVLDESLIAHLRVSRAYIERETSKQQREIERRATMYRGKYKPADVHNRTIVVVDDGIATGSTMIVTLRALRRQGAQQMIAAAPVIAAESLDRLNSVSKRVVSVHVSKYFASVGSFYQYFDPVSDLEVRELLADVIETRDLG